MDNTLSKARNLYLERVRKMPNRFNSDRMMRKMSGRLQLEFDNIWVKYNDNDATFEDFSKALDKWLKAELI